MIKCVSGLYYMLLIYLHIYFPNEVSAYSGHVRLNIFHHIFYNGEFCGNLTLPKISSKSNLTSLWKDFLIDDDVWVPCSCVWGHFCACGPRSYKEPFWPNNHEDQTNKQNFSLPLYPYLLPSSSYLALVPPLLKFLLWLSIIINYNVEV